MKQLFRIALMLSITFTAANHPLLAQTTAENDSLSQVLHQVLLLDQQVRKDYNNSNNAEEKARLRDKMIQQDSINQSIIFPIIDKLISGELTELPEEGWRACFLVVQHADLKNQLKYADFIAEYFKKGHINNYEYLIFIDRMHVRLNKAQLYGSQVAVLPNESFLVYPVCPKAQRDSAFKSINMDSRFFKVINGTMRYGASMQEDVLNTPSANQYEPIEIAQDEFAIIGLITSDKAKTKGIENVTVSIGNQVKATTDKNGFFYLKVKKDVIPDSLTLNIAEAITSYPLDKASYKGDFKIIAYSVEK